MFYPEKNIDWSLYFEIVKITSNDKNRVLIGIPVLISKSEDRLNECFLITLNNNKIKETISIYSITSKCIKKNKKVKILIFSSQKVQYTRVNRWLAYIIS